MKPTPLSLIRAYPEHIHVETDAEGVSDTDYNLECELEIGQNKEQERLWRVCVDVSFGGKKGIKAAYHGRIRYVGFFSVSEPVPKDKMERIIAVTAPSILYSSIRELVALLTGRGPGKAVMLPVVSFLDNANALVPPKVETAAPALPLKPMAKTKSTTRSGAQ
jgi:preprotein translocase subunit SecB